jgi:phosphoribosylamine--glycine ligase
MVSAQDHKRIFDGGLGPNTGGMGAFAPSRHYTEDIAKEVNERVFTPALKAMAEMGCPFKGVLYAGLMLTQKGLYVLEFNARFGDPETQVVLPLLEGDLLEIMLACRNGTLKERDIRFSTDSCAVVVMASAGYPGKPQIGEEINGLENVVGDDTWVIHAGTVKRNGMFYSNGGRVLGVCARGKDMESTINKAYDSVRKIGFRGMHFRRDIGKA